MMRAPLALALALLALACNRNKASTDGSGPAGSASGDLASASAPAMPSPLSILNGFEGEIGITFKDSTSASPPVPLSLLVKGDKLRVDIPEQFARAGGALLGGKAYVILDTPAKKLSIVSDPKKQVIVVDLEKSGEDLKNMRPRGLPGPGGASPGAPPKSTTRLTETGKYDTVAGQRCENWDVTAEVREATICVANQGVSFLHLPLTGIPTEQMWMLELLDGKHFPMRAISYAKDGQTETSRVEVTHIDKKSPPASAFEYPADYRVTDLAQMFRGLMSLPSGAPGFGALPAGAARR